MCFWLKSNEAEKRKKDYCYLDQISFCEICGPAWTKIKKTDAISLNLQVWELTLWPKRGKSLTTIHNQPGDDCTIDIIYHYLLFDCTTDIIYFSGGLLIIFPLGNN